MSRPPTNVRAPGFRRLLAPTIAIALAAASLVAGGAACGDDPAAKRSSTAPDATEDGGASGEVYPFEPVSPDVYVTKVKNLLTGMPATAEDIAAVQKDPNALKGLVDRWFMDPVAQQKLIGFYANAFQQNQIEDLWPQVDFVVRGAIGPVKEMFARTAAELVKAGRSWDETVTTHSFMMTTSLLYLYGYNDEADEFDVPHIPGTNYVWKSVVAKPTDAAYVPPEQTLDPTSPNFMTIAWYPRENFYADPACKSLVVNYNVRQMWKLSRMLQSDQIWDTPRSCTGRDNAGLWGPMKDADHSDWRMVTIRTPKPGEQKTRFYDIPKLRTATELVVDTPRVGFFSTLGFMGTYLTNDSNQARGIANQALIVALGKSILPAEGASVVFDNGNDAQHSDPSSPCYGCHQTLDPMRDVFRKNFDYNYRIQKDATLRASNPRFKFHSIDQPISNLDDFASALVHHPLFAQAWAQKLCWYANSAECSADDPEFLRVVKAFDDANHDFRSLVRELLASPLVTGASKTKTWTDRGEIVSISRYNHLCLSLTQRLRLTANVCNPTTRDADTLARANAASANIPSDGFARGAENPVLATDPTMFFQRADEVLCTMIADAAVDVGKTKADGRYQSATKDAAIADFVTSIMGLSSSSPIAAEATKVLQDHYAEAAALPGATPTDALKSTLVLACISPSSLAIGL